MSVFFVVGLIHASWNVNVPAVRDAFQLSPIELALVMFAVAMGAIIATLKVGPWLTRVGSRFAYRGVGIAMAASAALIPVMPGYWTTIIVLLLFGMTSATIDIAMNVEANKIEQGGKKAVMSTLHGMNSLGCAVGAAAVGSLIKLGCTPFASMACAALVTIATLVTAHRFVVPLPSRQPASEQQDSNSKGCGSVWVLGFLALIGLVGEGAMYNWSTIFMRDVVNATPAMASSGFVAFTGGMAVGRFAGDRLRIRIGAARLIGGGALLACIAMLTVLLVPDEFVTVIGFAAVGLGFANMVPLLFGAAGRVAGITSAQALARVAGLAYVGVFIGPVIIGGIAQLTSLSLGLATVGACAGIVCLGAPRTVRMQLD